MDAGRRQESHLDGARARRGCGCRKDYGCQSRGGALRCFVLPVDAIWFALKAATDPTSYPELHYFDPHDAEMLRLKAEYWCERHIRSAEAISQAMDPVIEYYLWERWPVIVEGAWITPAAAARWPRQYDAVRAVFIHEPDVDEVLAAMVARSGTITPRKKVSSKVYWLFGHWVREQALAEGLPVVDAPPRGTLTERVLAATELSR